VTKKELVGHNTFDEVLMTKNPIMLVEVFFHCKNSGKTIWNTLEVLPKDPKSSP